MQLTLLTSWPCMLGTLSTPAIMAAFICSGVRLGFAATMRAANPPPAPAASEVEPTSIDTSTQGLQHACHLTIEHTFSIQSKAPTSH